MPLVLKAITKYSPGLEKNFLCNTIITMKDKVLRIVISIHKTTFKFFPLWSILLFIPIELLGTQQNCKGGGCEQVSRPPFQFFSPQLPTTVTRLLDFQWSYKL